MKRVFIFIVFIGIFCHSVIAQEAVSLDIALKNTAEHFGGSLTAGSRVIIINVASEHTKLSEYIINELTMHFYNNGNFMMVDRQNLETIRQELNFQYSGEVSDESMVSIGRMLGAQIIISGAITKVGDTYRLQIRAIAVETAAILGFQSNNIVFDRMMASLTDTPITQAMIEEERRIERAEKFALDGKNAFAFSPNFLIGFVGDGFGFGISTNITVFERYYKRVAPSFFVTFTGAFSEAARDDLKVRVTDGNAPNNYHYSEKMDRFRENYGELSFLTVGGGVLLKVRINDRIIFNVGPSLEYMFNPNPDDSDQFFEDTPGLFALGLQLGFQFRVHRNISLDIGPKIKIGFGEWEYGCRETGSHQLGLNSYNWKYDLYQTYRPMVACMSAGVTIMFPYGGKKE